MKKICLAILSMAFITVAVAQEPVSPKPRFGGFVTNSLWDNWEISAGVGIGTVLSSGTNLGPKNERLGFEGNFSVAKWLHPVFGARIQLQGGKFNNFHPQYGKLGWPYLFVHVDAMANLSNWIAGYKEDRIYYAVPFVGMGYMTSNFTSASQDDSHINGSLRDFAATYGLINKFRVSNSFDINLELKGIVAPASASPAKLDGLVMMGFTASVGVTYRFNQRDFKRGVPGYTAADIERLNDNVNESRESLVASESENEELKNLLASSEARAAKAEQKVAEQAAIMEGLTAERDSLQQIVERDMAGYSMTGTTVFFDYGMSILKETDKIRLALIAEQINNGASDRTYCVYGYADMETGSPAGNKRVAENRAKNVYNCLIQLGVSPERISYQGMGEDPNRVFESCQVANRVAVIK